MTKDEALKMALKALEVATTPIPADRQEVLAAKKALRQALDQLPDTTEMMGLIPSEWAGLEESPNSTTDFVEPVYAFRRKGQEDFCTCDKRRYEELANKPDFFEVVTFYTAQPKREWKGLTDEELNDLARWADEHGGAFHVAYVKAIEAALKSKNGF